MVEGDNTVAIPSAATACAVYLPDQTDDDTVPTVTLKGASGDTGVALAKETPVVLTFDDPPQDSFILTVGAGDLPPDPVVVTFI